MSELNSRKRKRSSGATELSAYRDQHFKVIFSDQIIHFIVESMIGLPNLPTGGDYTLSEHLRHFNVP